MSKQTVMITGASRGIGKAIALKYAQEGYPVAINCRQNTDLLCQVKKNISSYHVPCFSDIGDISDFSYAEDFFSKTTATLGSPEILINNVGISHIGLFQEMSPQEWNHILQTNLTSLFNCCRLAVPSMVHAKRGKIINISSVWGCVGASMEVAYSTSKGGMNAFTKALAKELAPSNIQVNAVACGVIATEMNSFLSPDEADALMEEIPTGRMGEPQDVANFVYDLTQSTNYLTGQVIKLDGGWI